MRTPTGEYRIDYFNKYGKHLPQFTQIAGSLTAAHKVALDNMPLDAARYTIMRCLFNLLDKEERW